MSEAQIDWLMRSLSASDASFKIVISNTSILAPADVPENFAFADQQLESFNRLLRRNRIDGLIFVSGGKHYGELSKSIRPHGYNLFELSVGSTTYLDPNNPTEPNFSREPLTYSEAPQFGKIKVAGNEGNRIISLSLIETSGKVVFERSISQTDLAWDSESIASRN